MPRTSLNEIKRWYPTRTYRTYDMAGNLTGSSSDKPLNVSIQRYRSTVNTPGYRQIRRESLPMNPFTYTESSTHQPYGRAERIMPAWNSRETLDGPLANCDVDFSSSREFSTVSIDNEAIYNSLSRLKNMHVNLGVAFVERKQTEKLLVDTAGRLGNFYRGLRRGDLKGALTHLGVLNGKHEVELAKAYQKHNLRAKQGQVGRNLSNDWLAYQFGVAPLISDVFDSAEGLAAVSENRRVTMSSSKSRRWFKRTSGLNWWDLNLARRIEQGVYTRRYTYVFSDSNEVLTDLKRFGVTNPASWIWELTPWSFVIDYFSNIGRYIDLWDATVGLTFEKGCTTTFEKYTVRYEANGTAPYYTGEGNMQASARFTYVNCVRSPISTWPSLPVPDIENKLNLRKVTNLAALVRQKLRP